MSDVHKIAADYLESLEKGTFYRQERVYAVPVAVHAEIVSAKKLTFEVLKRAEGAPYFVGLKGCGRPVFTHDIKLAKSFEASSYSMMWFVKKLSEHKIEVVPHPTKWHEGRNINE